VLLAILVSWGWRHWYRYYYAPTPWRTMRLFVEALNREDWEAAYQFFAPSDLGGGYPLLPLPVLKRLLETMDPPFPKDLKVKWFPAKPGFAAKPGRFLFFEVEKKQWISGFSVQIAQHGQAPSPTGERVDTFDIGGMPTSSGWKIRAYFTFYAYYHNNYGVTAGQRFKNRYSEALKSLGLPDRLPRKEEPTG
jgi:hypothetical protein